MQIDRENNKELYASNNHIAYWKTWQLKRFLDASIYPLLEKYGGMEPPTYQESREDNRKKYRIKKLEKKQEGIGDDDTVAAGSGNPKGDVFEGQARENIYSLPGGNAGHRAWRGPNRGGPIHFLAGPAHLPQKEKKHGTV